MDAVNAFVRENLGGDGAGTTETPSAPSGGETAAGVGSPAPSGQPATAPAAGPLPGAAPPQGTQPQAPGQEQPPPGPVPYDRFLEVVRARQEAERQLSEFGQYRELVDGLTQHGYSPAEVAQIIQSYNQGGMNGGMPNGAPGATPGLPGLPFDQQQVPFGQAPPQQQGTPEEQYHRWLESKGVDPYLLGQSDPTMYHSHRLSFESQQQMQGWQRQMEQTMQQQAASELNAELQQVTGKHPEFQDPTLQRGLFAQYAQEIEQGRGASLLQIAERQMASVNVIVQARLAQYASQKAADSQVPVVTGGAAPPAYVPPEVGVMHDAEKRRAAVEAHLRAALGSGD